MTIKKVTKKALIMVDLQNDFCPGGNFAVSQADLLMPIANQLQDHFELIIATKDWHPLNHSSFAVNHPSQQVGDIVMIHGFAQVLWPVHCVQETPGAAFHPDLNTDRITRIFLKGIDPDIDSYSAFFDNEHKRSTGLGDYLQALQVDDIYLMGLATDYCVKYSALDALQLGFEVFVIDDACMGIELNLGDTTQALNQMVEAGVTRVSVKEAIASGR